MFISKLCIERKKNINTEYAVTAWVLCVITHIRGYVLKNTNINHMNQVNTVIKTFFAGSSEKEFHRTIVTFWSEYTNFSNNNDHFDNNKFIWSSKDIRDDNSHL